MPAGPSFTQDGNTPANLSNTLFGVPLIVPPNDGVQRTYLLGFRDQTDPTWPATGGNNGICQVVFNGIGGATIQYVGLGVGGIATYTNWYGVNGTVYVKAGSGGAIVPATAGPASIAAGDIPAIGSEIKIEIFSNMGAVGQWFSGPASNNNDGCIHAYISGFPNQWIVQEVEGESILNRGTLGAGLGHFRYSVHCVNAAQIGSYLDFWENMGGSSTGGSASPAGGGGPGLFVGTPMPPTPTYGTPGKYTQTFSAVTSVVCAHGLGTTAVVVQVWDNGSPSSQVIPQTCVVTDANTVTLTFGISFSGSVVIFG
jgi:hypothetical protein